MRRSAAFSGRYSRRDLCVALALTLAVFLLGFGQLTRGVSNWGDDSAAYITEGIAIARGELREQTQRNLELHPTPLPEDIVAEDGLVYVWGFPLLLALVYRLVGFDTANYSSVIYYKYPSLICLSLLAGALFLLLRRRFSRRTAAAAALVFCLSNNLMLRVNMLYADVCFLFAMVLALLLLEMFLDAESAPPIGLGVALGASLWFAYEVRLNGITICLTAAIAQLIYLAGPRERRAPGNLLRHLIPYVTLAALVLLSERLLLPATSNMSSVGDSTPKKFLTFFAYYGYMTLDFLNSLTGFPILVGMLLFIPAVIGLVRDGFRREDLHLTLLFLGTYLVILTLPFRQRHYIYSALPVMVIYAVRGCQRIFAWWKARAKGRVRPEVVARVLVCALLGCTLLHSAVACCQNLAADRSPRENEMYCAQAVDMYAYIQQNTPEDAVIACAKPRMLYLNTGRQAFRVGYNGHKLADAGYYLYLSGSDIHDANLVTDENREEFETLYQTRDLALYRILGR